MDPTEQNSNNKYELHERNQEIHISKERTRPECNGRRSSIDRRTNGLNERRQMLQVQATGTHVPRLYPGESTPDDETIDSEEEDGRNRNRQLYSNLGSRNGRGRKERIRR